MKHAHWFALLLSAPVAALAVPPATNPAPAQNGFATTAPAAAATARPAAPAGAANEADPALRQFQRWDTDHNGSLSLEEFRRGYQQAEHNIAVAQLRAQFIARDTDKSGYLEKGEYEALPLVKAEGARAAPFAQIDKNGDGRLDFSEYAELVVKAVGARR